MPTSEKGSTITVSWLKLDTSTGTLHPDGSTNVRPTTKPVFSANTVSPSSRPLDENDRPPTVRVVQCSTASEHGGIEQCPTVNTRPDSAALRRCSCSDTPPSVNSSPFFISRVCGSIHPNVSVPMMASVLRSHTKTGNSVRRPKNDTMQDEHPEIVIGDPLAPRSFLSVGHNTPTGAPAFSSVW